MGLVLIAYLTAAIPCTSFWSIIATSCYYDEWYQEPGNEHLLGLVLGMTLTGLLWPIALVALAITYIDKNLS